MAGPEARGAAGRLILASASKARVALLSQAGLVFDAIPAAIDERAVSAETPRLLAQELARRKALHVAALHPGALVIGGDQVLSCEGRLYSKAADENEARRNLQSLRGKTHELISAVCVARDDEILWQHVDSAAMTMAAWDDAFLDAYIVQAHDALIKAVGCYELEGLGSWLFERVEGDYFTVLGLPLLPLLRFLRTKGFGP